MWLKDITARTGLIDSELVEDLLDELKGQGKIEYFRGQYRLPPIKR